MATYAHSGFPYLRTVEEEPRETYVERTIENYRQAIIEHPEDELKLFQQMFIYKSVLGPNEEIMEWAEKLFALDTKKEYITDYHLARARVYADENKIEEAIECYRKYLEIEPTSDEIILDLAQLYMDRFDYDNAFKVYALLDNDDIMDGKENMYRNHGNIYYNKQEFDNAQDCYKKALAISPEDEDGYISESIGETYWQKKQYKEAMEWFTKALANNPESANAHYGMGLCYQDTDDYYRALHHYTEAVKIQPDFTNAHNNIAAIIINDEGDMKRGIALLEKAVEVAEDKTTLGQVYLNLSRAYNKISDYDKAEHYKALFIKSMGFDVGYEEGEDDGGDVLS